MRHGGAGRQPNDGLCPVAGNQRLGRGPGRRGVVFTGKAKKPVYVWIENDHVEIRSAEKL